LTPDHCILDFHVQPRARRTEVVGWHGDSIKVRLQAPPADGAANDELVRFVAKTVGVPQSAVHIVSGERGRSKRVSLDGTNRTEVLRALGLVPD